MKNLYRFTASFSIAAVLSMPTMAQADGFDGKTFTVTTPTWVNDAPGTVLIELGLTDSREVSASNAVSPDIADLLTAGGGFNERWNVHFDSNTITFEFTPIYIRNLGDQVDYMYTMPTGFRIQDTQNQLPPIVGVTIDDRFAPFGFEASLTRFDENNIWVSLNGSMCHFYGMGSMPTCTNPASPTGYDNIIKLAVQFAAETPQLDKDRVDRLFDWAESYYPGLFPFSAESFDIFGYYARCYGDGFCIGAKDGHVFGTGGPWGAEIKDLGRLEDFYGFAGL